MLMKQSGNPRLRIEKNFQGKHTLLFVIISASHVSSHNGKRSSRAMNPNRLPRGVKNHKTLYKPLPARRKV